MKGTCLTCVDDILYADINYVPDPIVFAVKLKITNNEGFTCYYKVKADGTPPAGWTLDEQNLGSVVNGGVGTFTYTGFKRTKPASIATELEETVDTLIEVYTDAGYTDLFCAVSYGQQFVLIDYTSVEWTTHTHNNFDDGTVQGWVGPGAQGFGASTAYYKSPPYSLYALMYAFGDYYIYKNFTVGNLTKAFVVLNMYGEWFAGATNIPFLVRFDTSKEYQWWQTRRVWYQWCFPFPVNATTQLRIGQWVGSGAIRFYMDDFRLLTR